MSGNDSANSSERKSPKVTAHIRRDHESDLRWYFEHGVRYFEQRSNMDAQIERLKLYGEHARPCKACGGDPAKDKPGSGFITDGSDFREYLKLCGLLEVPLDVQAWCAKHNQQTKKRRRKEPSEDVEFEDYLDGEILCPKCAGKGWIPKAGNRSRGPLTARPTKSSIQGNGVPDTGGTESMARLGMVSRRLSAASRLSPIASAALESYYSPSGGTIACLWWLTPAGRTMLRENELKVPEREFFKNLRSAQERNPNDKRRLQFETANRQAEEVYSEACRVWNEASGVAAVAA